MNNSAPVFPPSRAVNGKDVEQAADALLRAGQRPTTEAVRVRIGRGSPNTINPLLTEWWGRLSARFAAIPEATQSLPAPVAAAAEYLWLEALGAARARVGIEETETSARLLAQEQRVALDGHAVRVKEAELASRLQDLRALNTQLKADLSAALTLFHQERQVAESHLRRLAHLQARLRKPRVTLKRPPRKAIKKKHVLARPRAKRAKHKR